MENKQSDVLPWDSGSKMPAWVFVVGAVCLFAAAAGYWHYIRVQPKAPPAPVSQMEAPASSPEPNAAVSAPVNGEELIQARSAQLSANANLAGWLKSDDIVRRFVASVDAIASGKSPRQGLVFWRPKRNFSTSTKGDEPCLDPRSYARYDLAAEAFQSVNAQAVASLFNDLKPVLQTAYEELGYQHRDFQDTMVRAMQELLKVPVVEGRIRLKEKGIAYSMADTKLEALSSSQKHLLRMGPRNTAKIQDKLREIARAMGVADDKLPGTQAYKAR